MCSGIASSENPQESCCTPASWAAKHGVTWAADLKAKLQTAPESSAPFLILFSSTAVAKQQFGTSPVLPQTSSCLQPSQWSAHTHSLAFHLGPASRELRFVKPFSWVRVTQKQTQSWGQNRSCSHGSCLYTPGWHILMSCKSDPMLEAAEIFLSPLLASHASGISVQLPVETCCILPCTGEQSTHSSRVIKGIIQKEDRKGFAVHCTALPCCCSVML